MKYDNFYLNILMYSKMFLGFDDLMAFWRLTKI